MRPAGPWVRFFPKITLPKVPVIVPVMAVECFLYVQDDKIRHFGKFPENWGSWGHFSGHFVKKIPFFHTNRVNAKKKGKSPPKRRS